MNNSIRSKDLSQLKRQFCFSTLRRLLVFLGLLAGLLMFEQPARAHQEPPGCSGSGLGISLFTSAPNVHIGDAISYNVLVFNTPFPACNAGEPSPAAAGAIRAFVVTPDGVTNQLVLQRTFLERCAPRRSILGIFIKTTLTARVAASRE
jgi:hypothetical protein